MKKDCKKTIVKQKLIIHYANKFSSSINIVNYKDY